MSFHSVNYYSPAAIKKGGVENKGSIAGTLIDPIECPVEILRLAHQRIDYRDRVSSRVAGKFSIQDYLVEGGVMIKVLHDITDAEQQGIELASRTVPELKATLQRLKLPITGIENLL